MSFFKHLTQKFLLLAVALLFLAPPAAIAELKTREAAEAAIRQQNQLIAKEPQHAAHYVQRALGVVFAKRQRCDLAVTHFATAIELDPSYQKAYHNLGICFYISSQYQAALEVVDAGLQLDAENRSSLVLKAAILTALGRKTEAQKTSDDAEFLPEDNWTERSTLRDQGADTQR